MIIIFWVSLFLIFYTFAGYGLVLFVLIRIKRLFKKTVIYETTVLMPTVTVLVAAYNEEDLIEEKVLNTINLDYPKEKVQFIFITDGSTDRTAERIRKYNGIMVLHEDQRSGKMAAIKRAIPFITGEITVFTDANTFLNKEALLELIKHYQNPKVGAVAGEKRIMVAETADASSAGEGFYWKYESTLKKWDYELYSNVGAAGELFSIRTTLYQPVESDTIIDDHMIAMRIAENGYIIAYEPKAYAMETASADVKEELKRKIRIAAGGIQSILRLKKAANPFHYPIFTFQYISHRVLRWTITPFLLILVFILNALLAFKGAGTGYSLLFIAQIVFYCLALTGYFFEKKNIRVKVLFIPYYFCVMNYAVLAGLVRYLRKSQSAAWEKSRRK
ncbi:glycosyltransferase family 2 protein [Pedobacter sp.]|jgi:biofilm PGA synthesis N-glycosyltransferase PgaC|uniref:glycosyltransferase family 2 protein n=1 Tax=Pedobacter sp. TaxID=1411316 RepID=UPI002D0B9259|nr:glycosyltransferase family 2 protein [Pedobacter sp.]HWW42411.1 glycosyltransferase family 2 protein [Pedobacter sp.]